MSDSPDLQPDLSPPTFDVLPLTPELRKAIDALGYVHPTPVQLAVFEPAVRGKNLVVQARTGTGKTAAFGLPLLDQLVRKGSEYPQALILTPTRELALQITSELERLGQFRGIKIAAIYGGAPMGKQLEALSSGSQIIVGTPGRLLDHLRRGSFDPSGIRVFVLDEADEMLSMGFAKELTAIAEMLPPQRQGFFFSATLPPDMERLAARHLKDPEFITLSSDQVGALSIAHFIYLVYGGDKRQLLLRILEVEDPESAVIFCNTKEETERVTEAIQNKGYDADWLSSDLEQKNRERVMNRLREGKLRFLVATDIAARGIDISHLTHVINFDFPENAEYYVHRTGRTGRADRTGTAISLVGPKDIGNLYILRLTYKIRPIEKPLPTDHDLKTRAEQDLIQLFMDAFARRPVDAQDLSLARRLLTHLDGEKVIAGLLRDHLGARPNTKGDPSAEAAEARRARNPKPIDSRPQLPIPPRRDGKSREPSKENQGALSSSLLTWAPPPAVDDDEPILLGAAPSPPHPPAARWVNRNKINPSLTLNGPIQRDRSTPAPRPLEASKTEEGLAQIFMNLGRRDGLRLEDIHRMLGEKGIDPRAAKHTRILERVSFISVQKDSLEQAILALSGRTFAGRPLIVEPARERPLG